MMDPVQRLQSSFLPGVEAYGRDTLLDKSSNENDSNYDFHDTYQYLLCHKEMKIRFIMVY